MRSVMFVSGLAAAHQLTSAVVPPRLRALSTELPACAGAEAVVAGQGIHSRGVRCQRHRNRCVVGTWQSHFRVLMPMHPFRGRLGQHHWRAWRCGRAVGVGWRKEPRSGRHSCLHRQRRCSRWRARLPSALADARRAVVHEHNVWRICQLPIASSLHRQRHPEHVKMPVGAWQRAPPTLGSSRYRAKRSVRCRRHIILGTMLPAGQRAGKKANTVRAGGASGCHRDMCTKVRRGELHLQGAICRMCIVAVERGDATLNLQTAGTVTTTVLKMSRSGRLVGLTGGPSTNGAR